MTPMRLTPEQEQAVQAWAADDRLWTAQETVAFNLRVFARVILAAGESRGIDRAPDAARPDADREADRPPRLELDADAAANVDALIAAELASKGDQRLDIRVNADALLRVAGLLQFALCAPDVPPPLREVGEAFLAGVGTYFVDCPTVCDVLRHVADPTSPIRPSWGQ